MILPLENRLRLLCIALLLSTAGGCSVWPYGQKERSSVITPGMRMAAIREIGAQAPDTGEAEQNQLCVQLAQQIQAEPDPLVRQEIQNAVAAFSTPLAQRMLLAGLNDEDREVRLTCCYRLAERAEPETLAALREAMVADPDLDVRLAAIDALAKIQTSETVAALGTALNDRDPAVQYAAVQALKNASGEDFGNDVSAWQQYIATGSAPEKPDVSVAQRLQQYSPF